MVTRLVTLLFLLGISYCASPYVLGIWIPPFAPSHRALGCSPITSAVIAVAHPMGAGCCQSFSAGSCLLLCDLMRFLHNKCHTYFFFYLDVENEQGQGMKQKGMTILHPSLICIILEPGVPYLEVYLQFELEGTDCNSFSRSLCI